jgi:hypothetical protein
MMNHEDEIQIIGKADFAAGLFCLENFPGRGARVSLTKQLIPNYAFFGAIASFAAFATRNFTTVFALI